MSIKQKRFLWSALIIILPALPVIALVVSATSSKPIGTKSEIAAPRVSRPSAVAKSVPTLHLRTGKVLPQLQFALKALGDRLSQPGKERLTLTGTLRWRNDVQPTVFALVSELPGQLRLTTQQGINQRTLIFDGQKLTSADNRIDQNDRVLLETLFYDAPDRFFMGQMDETAPRFLGARFRADDGTQSGYTGPYYDIYQVTDNIKTDEVPRGQVKLYCFNSINQLLERVQYTISAGGGQVEVEIQVDDWRSDQNQQIPRRITRLENGQPIFTLTINSVLVSPQVKDGIFGPT